MERKRIATGLFGALGMLCLILDSKTGILAARSAVRLCIMTVIPSLLPFFFLTGLITGNVSLGRRSWLRPLERLLRLPEGGSGYLIPGFLGGYPMGAKAIGEGVSRDALSRKDGERMLFFCSNAGPAFLFGMVAPCFKNPGTGLALWLIHMVSALLIGAFLPGTAGPAAKKGNAALPVSQAMESALKAMAVVCGWILCFHVLLAFLGKWFLAGLPRSWQILTAGILELASGCSMLPEIDSEALRFCMAAGMLGFGGICVMMQTASVIGALPFRNYVLGKLLHGVLSTAMAASLVSGFWPFLLILLVSALVISRKRQRNTGISPAHAV